MTAYFHYIKGKNPIGVWHVASEDRTHPACRCKPLSWEKGAQVVIKESPVPPQHLCYICKNDDNLKALDITED